MQIKASRCLLTPSTKRCIIATVLLSCIVQKVCTQSPSLLPSLDSCMPLVLEDLGNTSVITSIGFLSNSLGIRVDTTIRRQAQDFFPDIRAVDFHVVCEVAGLERGTVSMVSFVADFECDNDGRSSPRPCPPQSAVPVQLHYGHDVRNFLLRRRRSD